MSGKDLQASGDSWEPYDVWDGAPSDDATLESLGWESLLDLGSSDDIGFAIMVWQRSVGDGGTEYLLNVWGFQSGSPYLKVDSFPAVMELVAKWAPVLQAASVAHVVQDLAGLFVDRNGLVETVAARAAWGVQEKLGDLKEELDGHDRAIRERRRARRDCQ
ncbi:hypothetical protein [Amycolatopsis plumensis]|uniref:Uncharacterized protein n=1 Tax=Amycolatopsis plumensis TaxID=236508 RepID=A0ABV5UAM2_9PSEU